MYSAFLPFGGSLPTISSISALLGQCHAKAPLFSLIISQLFMSPCIKESFAGFWQQEGRWHAQGYFSKWYSRARRSRLEPVKKVAKSLKNHLDGLLNYFIHPITNAVTEGLNSRIQEIKANARGFRSFDNYRTRILFFCGKLNFFPA